MRLPVVSPVAPTATFVAGAAPKFCDSTNCAASTTHRIHPANHFARTGRAWTFLIGLYLRSRSSLFHELVKPGRENDDRGRKLRPECGSCQIRYGLKTAEEKYGNPFYCTGACA